MIDRVAPVGELEDERAEAGLGEFWQRDRLRVDVGQGECERVQFGLRGALVERGQGQLRASPGQQRKDVLLPRQDSVRD